MNKNKLQLVNFEQAKLLKEAGFDWATDYYYNIEDKSLEFFDFDTEENHNEYDDCYSAPLIPIALKWFRDVKKIRYSIGIDYSILINGKFLRRDVPTMVLPQYERFNTYEQSENALLDELLTIIENQ
jgi:hypothetical protein